MSLPDLDINLIMSLIAEKGAPKIAAACKKHGVNSLDELPQEIAGEIVNSVLIRVAAEHFPAANIDQLSHGLRAFHDKRFFPALQRVKSFLAKGYDAFAIADGIDIAIVIAGLGLAVTPLDRRTGQRLSEPSNVIDEVYEKFSNLKTARVGYSPCDVGFYIVLTDCINSLFNVIDREENLRELRELIDRDGRPERRPVAAWKHGMILLARQPHDTLGPLFFDNPRANEGSIAFFAGHKIGDERFGVPNEGFVPVPLQFVANFLERPEIATWLWGPTKATMVLH
jgi:hypothetical protein